MLKLKRARFIFSPNESEAALKISSLQLSDEAVYRCEITYLEINEGCPVVQYVNLTVYGMVLVYMYGGLFFCGFSPSFFVSSSSLALESISSSSYHPLQHCRHVALYRLLWGSYPSIPYTPGSLFSRL